MLSAFFSGSEIAFVSANRLGIAMQKEDGSQKSKIVNRFYEKPKEFLSTMLIGNNIALVALTYFMTQWLEGLFPGLESSPFIAFLFFTLIITIFVLIFGEFLPKTFFSLYSNQLINTFGYPLVFFKYLLAIPTWFMTALSNGILKLFKIPNEKIDYRLSQVDLEDYFEENIGEADAEIDKVILTNALTLRDLRVRDCMIPRTEIIYHDISNPISDLIAIIEKTKLSRVIIIDGDIENTIGYIHHQQLLTKPKTLKNILMEIPIIPEAMNLNDLLMNFIKERNSIALVVDEYGSTAGIITLEDILEEIFGEIEDEHDEEDYIDEMYGDQVYRFSGRLEIDHINEKYPAIVLPDGDYQTLSGFIVQLIGSIPEEGQEIPFENLIFTIEEISDKKIEVVLVRHLKNNDDDIE